GGAAVHVEVVGQDAGGGDRQRRVLGGGVTVGDRHRGVIDRGDRQGDGGHVAVQGPVAGRVSEGVAAVVVGRRRVRERAVGAQRHGPVRRAGHEYRRQRTALHIGVVAEHAGGADGQRRVLG